MAPPTLRDYQLDVIERVRDQLRKGKKRVIIQGATGSGKTTVGGEIIRCAAQKGKRVLWLAARRRLISQASGRIAEFGIPHGVLMAGVAQRKIEGVQIASRDTLLSRSVRNEWLEPPPADIVVVDECHGCISREYQTLLGMYSEATIIGLTATPARADGKGMAPYFESIECTIPTSELINRGCLVPVKCFAPDRSKDHKGLAGDPVSNWKLYGNGRPTVLFAAKVEASIAAISAFNQAGIPAEHMDAHTPDEEREAIIARVISGQTKVVGNVGVLTEGVDIPPLSCCVLLRMAGSYVLFAQAVGRVMRAHPGKKDAVLIDHAGAIERHGFPDEDVTWTLDEGDTVDRRIKEDKEAGKRKEPIVCPDCACVFAGSISCPACGHVLPRRSRKAEVSNEILVEVPRGEIDVARSVEKKIRLWHRCLATMAYKGQSCAAASGMYRSQTGEWPDGNILPNVPHKSQWRMAVRDLYPNYLKRNYP